MKNREAIIAGGGLAGLAAAIQLDELGYHVTLVEKKSILGGRAYSFTDRITGLTVDNGQHLMVGAYHETLRFLEKIGAKHKVAFESPTTIPLLDENQKKMDFIIRNKNFPWQLGGAVLGFKGFSLADKIRFYPLARELFRMKKGRQKLPTNVTVEEWLLKLKQSLKSRKNFWDIVTLATLNDEPTLTSADGLATVLLKTYWGSAQDGLAVFPKVGLSELFAHPAEAYLQCRGHTIKKGVGLKQVKIMDGQVRSFEFWDGSEIKADVYVSALPFQALLKTLPPALLETQTHLKPIQNFTTSPILSVNLFFEKKFMAEKLVGSARTKIHWFFCKDSIVKTPSTLSHIVGVISGAYHFRDQSKEEIIAMAKQDLAQIYPQSRSIKLIHALVNKEQDATLSSRVGVNPQRPPQKILENFYIVGDWTQTGLPATIESAVVSAKLMAEQMNGCNF
jgi:squalene-associated FAD-dependent desaturase